MKNKSIQIKSLTQQVRWQLTLLGGGLFLASLVLLSLFSFHAIETTTKNLIRLEAQTIVRESLERPGSPLVINNSEKAYREWLDLPLSTRQLFTHDNNVDVPPPISDHIHEAVRLNENNTQEYFYLLHYYDDQFGDLFLVSHHDANDIERVGIRLFLATLQQSFLSAFVIFIALFFLIRWLIRRTSEPLILLSDWAKKLGSTPSQPLKPNFPIQELNELATQLREGVDQLEAYNRREQEFLCYASHELRTPLGIIQASLDTIALQTQGRSVQRALKASDHVRQLLSALLWLAQSSDRSIEQSTIYLNEVTEKIIDDHRYLLLNKKTDIHMKISIEYLIIEEELFLIVLSNLIRNAFHHCTEGVIDIAISRQALTICNAYDTSQTVENVAMVQSFGIGLQLVERICQKLNWQFDYIEEHDRVRVCIIWPSADTK